MSNAKASGGGVLPEPSPLVNIEFVVKMRIPLSEFQRNRDEIKGEVFNPDYPDYQIPEKLTTADNVMGLLKSDALDEGVDLLQLFFEQYFDEFPRTFTLEVDL